MINDQGNGLCRRSVGQAILACPDVPAVVALLQAVRSSFGDEVIVDPGSPVDVKILTLVVSAPAKALCAGCKTPEHVLDALLDEAAMAAAVAKVSPGLVSAAGFDIGTHIPKVPNPRVGTEGFFQAARVLPAQIPFLCGDLPAARRRVGGSGNAGRAPATRFLRYRIRFGDLTGSLAEVMAQSVAFRDLLVRAGWPRDVVAAAAQKIYRKLAGPGRIDRVDPASKVLLYPLPRRGYRQITPVHAVPLWYEMRTRIRRDAQRPGLDRRTYPIRRRSIGGTKAQNVAVEASDAGGQLELLHSLPPQFRPLPKFDRLLHRVRTTGTGFAPAVPPAGLVEVLRRMSRLDDEATNIRVREAQQRVVGRLAAIALEGPLALMRAVEAGLAVDPRVIRDPVERVLVTEGFEALDPGGVADLVRRVGGWIAGLADSDADPLRLFVGDAARDLVLRGLERAVDPTDEGPDDTEAETSEDGDDEAEAPAPAAAGKPPRRTKPTRGKA